MAAAQKADNGEVQPGDDGSDAREDAEHVESHNRPLGDEHGPGGDRDRADDVSGQEHMRRP